MWPTHERVTDDVFCCVNLQDIEADACKKFETPGNIF